MANLAPKAKNFCRKLQTKIFKNQKGTFHECKTTKEDCTSTTGAIHPSNLVGTWTPGITGEFLWKTVDTWTTIVFLEFELKIPAEDASEESEDSQQGESGEDQSEEEESVNSQEDEDSGSVSRESQESEDDGQEEVEPKLNPFPGPKLTPQKYGQEQNYTREQNLDTFPESLQVIQNVNLEITEVENHLARMFVGFTKAEPYYKNKNFRATSEKNFYDGPESSVPNLNNHNQEYKRGLTALEEGEALLNNLRNTDPRLMNQNGNRNNFYYDQPPAKYRAHENVNLQEIERLKLESEKDANEAL